MSGQRQGKQPMQPEEGEDGRGGRPPRPPQTTPTPTVVPEISVEDYDLEGDDDIPDIPIREARNFLDEEADREQNHPRHSASRQTGFDVEVEDEQGNRTRRRLDVAGVNSLDPRLQVVVEWNQGTDQPIGNGGHLFNRYLSELGGNWLRFPLAYKAWTLIPKPVKVLAYEEAVQTKFSVRQERRRYALLKMGTGWRNRRNRLFRSVDKDGTIPLDELIAAVPDGVDPHEWARFVQYRRSPEGQEKKAAEEERQTHYGELFAFTHRHRDGTATSQQAEEAIAKMHQYATHIIESQPPESQGSAMDPTAPLKAGVGEVEHPGRVRGMGLGARPTMVYGRGSESHTSRAGTSGVRRRSDTTVEELREQLASQAEQVEQTVATQVASQMEQVERQMEQRVASQIGSVVSSIQVQLDEGYAYQAQWRDIANALLKRMPDAPEIPPVPRITLRTPTPTPSTSQQPAADRPEGGDMDSSARDAPPTRDAPLDDHPPPV